MDEEDELFDWAVQAYESETKPESKPSQPQANSNYQVHLSIDKAPTGEESVGYIYLTKDGSRGGGR